MTCQHGYGDHPFTVPPDTPIDSYYLIVLLRKRSELPQGMHLVKYLDIKVPATKSAIMKNIGHAYKELNKSTKKLVPGDVFYVNANYKTASFDSGCGVIITRDGFLLVSSDMLACWFSRWFSDDMQESYDDCWMRYMTEHGMIPSNDVPTLFERWAPSLN